MFFNKRKITWEAPRGQAYNLFLDALDQPHLLIAGATGSGKSVLINGLIHTLLYRVPCDVQGGMQLILIDPKRVELAAYKGMPHTICNAAGFDPSAWVSALEEAVSIMDERYSYMEQRGLKKYDKGDLYVVIDEWAAVYKNGGGDSYRAVLRLISEGRAARVHVIMATQVPKATIIPTEIRENFSARFCLFTNTADQSRVIMEAKGCEDLPDPRTAGYALGYYVLPGKNNNTLYQIPYVQDAEIEQNIAWWNEQKRKNRVK